VDVFIIPPPGTCLLPVQCNERGLRGDLAVLMKLALQKYLAVNERRIAWSHLTGWEPLAICTVWGRTYSSVRPIGVLRNHRPYQTIRCDGSSCTRDASDSAETLRVMQ
jgi:hypothetical protein